MPDTPHFDTIAAIATAPGRGAVALLRVSGPGAREVASRVAPGAVLQPRVQALASLRSPETGELLDRALVTLFPAPASYTGEDVVELGVHGGTVTPQLVLDALFAAGCRLAEPGEFTRRAYVNGRMDLLQAEAVLDLVEGSSRAMQRAALHQMERGLSGRISGLREELIGLEALTIYSIDFPEEDEPPVPPARIRAAAEAVRTRMERLLATAPQGELLREGALVVLAGRPNAGKSSLFNALLGRERAIVTEVPGTTRDALEAHLTVNGYPFRLVDTAGLRRTTDLIEGMGIEVAQRYLAAADLVLYCVESREEPGASESSFLDDLPAERVVMVRTKSDLHTGGAPERADAHLAVSTMTGEGLDALGARLVERAFGGIVGEVGHAPLVTRERHARALRQALAEVGSFATALDDGLPMEFAATHLREAAGILEDLIGAVGIEDLLDRVFGDFCVGK